MRLLLILILGAGAAWWFFFSPDSKPTRSTDTPAASPSATPGKMSSFLKRPIDQAQKAAEAIKKRSAEE